MTHPAYQLAKGGFQIQAITDMLEEGCSPSLLGPSGARRQWSRQYGKSLNALIDRLKAAGFEVELRQSGPRGGQRWHIVNRETVNTQPKEGSL